MPSTFAMSLEDEGLRKRLGRVRSKLDDPLLMESAGKWLAKEYLRGRLIAGDPGWTASRRGGQPLYDVGSLAGGFEWETFPGKLVITNRFTWAWVHNEGATISAKSSAGMRVPSSVVMAMGNSKRRTATPKSFPEGFYFTKKSTGQLFYARVKGTRTAGGKTVGAKTAKRKAKAAGKPPEIEVLFVYVKQVKMPERRFMEWTTEAKDGLKERILGELEALEGEA
jgi:phage gpG-like protein